MTESTARRRAQVIVTAGVVSLSLACSNTARGCGNEAEIWLNRVMQEQECPGCVALPFPAHLLPDDTLRISEEPDHVLPRCAVAEVRRFDDAVALIWSPKANESLGLFRETLARNSESALVAVRLSGAQLPVGVVDAEDLEVVLFLLDFASVKKIDQFIDGLNPDEKAIARRKQRLMTGSADHVRLREEGDQLLRDMEDEDRMLEELDAAIERGADDAAIQSLLDQLELPDSGERTPEAGATHP